MSNDYNEMLISEAGGDGENIVRISITTTAPGKIPHIEDIHFTNVPMHRVHAAIAVLNGDGEDALPAGYESLAHKLAANKTYGEHASRTRDFTMLELFPHQEGYKFSFVPQECCSECGAFVPYEESRVKHVTWHNKTLP